MKKTLSILIATVCFQTAAFTAEAQPLFTPSQEDRIHALVREALLKNPEILEEVATALQTKYAKAEVDKQQQAIKTYHEQIFNDADSPRIGAKDAKLTLVYFTDYNCPYCKRFDPEILALTKKYPDLAVIIKPVPFLGESSQEAAELTNSLWLQQPEKFSQVHHDIMAKKSRHDDESLKAILAKEGVKNFTTSEKGKAAVARNLELTRRLGIRGTPATIVGDQLVSGAVPIDTLEQLVKSKLK